MHKNLPTKRIVGASLGRLTPRHYGLSGAAVRRRQGVGWTKKADVPVRLLPGTDLCDHGYAASEAPALKRRLPRTRSCFFPGSPGVRRPRDSCSRPSPPPRGERSRQGHRLGRIEHRPESRHLTRASPRRSKLRHPHWGASKPGPATSRSPDRGYRCTKPSRSRENGRAGSRNRRCSRYRTALQARRRRIARPPNSIPAGYIPCTRRRGPWRFPQAAGEHVSFPCRPRRMHHCIRIS